MSIGVGQRRTGRCFDAQMSQLAPATLQSAFNLSQRVSAAQLAEQHGDKLVPTRQPLAAAFRLRCFDEAFKVGSWNKLEYLAEHAA